MSTISTLFTVLLVVLLAGALPTLVESGSQPSGFFCGTKDGMWWKASGVIYFDDTHDKIDLIFTFGKTELEKELVPCRDNIYEWDSDSDTGTGYPIEPIQECWRTTIDKAPKTISKVTFTHNPDVKGGQLELFIKVNWFPKQSMLLDKHSCFKPFYKYQDAMEAIKKVD